MGAFENELVNDAVYSHRAAYELGLCVFGILEDKVVTIKDRKVFSPHTASELIIVNSGKDTRYGIRSNEMGIEIRSPWGCGSRKAPGPL